jgi:cytochrome c-type biogenesis protein CcmE
MTEAGAEERTSAPAPNPGRTTRPRLRLALVGVVVVAAIGFLLVKGLGSSLDYFKTVNEAVVSKAQLGTSTFRLEGTVVKGSVERRVNGASFDIAQGGKQVRVVNSGTPPQLFKDDMPVVVVGHFASATSTTFLSDQIMVKHTSTYIAKHPDRVTAKDGSKS